MPRHLLLLLALALSLTGCGIDKLQSDDTSQAAETETVAQAETQPQSDAAAQPETDNGPTTTLAGGPSALTDLTFCVDGADDGCTTGEDTDTVQCEAIATGTSDGSDVDAWITYDGERIQGATIPNANVAAVDAGEPLTLSVNLLGSPLPSGTYTCEVTDASGTAALTSVVSNGPSDPFYDVQTCHHADAISVQGGASVCQDDVKDLTGTVEANCSMVAVGSPDLTFEYEWTPADEQLFSSKKVHVELKDLPYLAPLSLWVEADAFSTPGGPTFEAGDPLPAGDYVCRVLDRATEQTLAETDFVIR